MRDWFSNSELAEMALPDMPKRRETIRRKAQREGWKMREVPTPGGGPMRLEIHICSLPIPAQAELMDKMLRGTPGHIESQRIKLRQRLEERARQVRREAGMAEAARLDTRSRAQMDARLDILYNVEQLQRETGLPMYKLVEHVATLYNSRAIDGIEATTYDLIAEVSGRTIQRWRKALDEHGPSALAPRHGKRSARDYRSLIDEDDELRAVVLGMIHDNPHVSATHIMRGLRARFERERIPSKRTIQRYIQVWSKQKAQLKTYISNPDQWRGRYRAAYGSASDGIVRLNQRWELDSTPADVMLTDGRHAIIGMIDVYSRRTKLHVVRTSTSAGIISLLRRAISSYGMPETVATDQGKDYVSKAMKRVLPSLGIEHLEMPPFSPDKKPFIERFFRTFSHDLVEILPGFIGHNVAERQDIEARRSFAERMMKKGETVEIELDVEAFQELCDRWCDDIYAHESHAGLDGRTPFQAASGQPTRRVEDDRALDLLLSSAPGGDGLKTVTKKGIRIQGLYYMAPELSAHAGEQVLCLYDEADAGRLYVFGGIDAAFICIAECPDITGISRQKLAIEARRYHERHMREQRAELKAVSKRTSTADIWREIVDTNAATAAKMRSMDGAQETHETDALSAASAAADAREAMDAPRELRRENPPEVQARIRALYAEQNKPFERPQYWDNAAHRFRWVKEAALGGHGALITEADWDFYHDYADDLGLGPEDRVMQRQAK